MTTPEVRRQEGVSHQNGLEQAIGLYKQSDFFLSFSEITRLGYTADLTQFQEYCETEDISSMARQIGSENIRNWHCQLKQAGKAPATVNRKSSSLSTFLNWAQAEGIIQPDFTIDLPKSEPKAEKKQPRILTAEEIDLLISKAKKLRDASLISIARATGATITEIVNLNAEDILRAADGNIVIRFKGGVHKTQPRTLEIDKKSIDKITEYIKSSGLKPEDPLFRGFNAQYRSLLIRLTRQGAHLMLKRYRREIGVEDLNPSMLRNTFIANFAGTPRELDEVLGRRNPKTARSAYSPRRLLKI